jgi:hypothetical protein
MKLCQNFASIVELLGTLLEFVIRPLQPIGPVIANQKRRDSVFQRLGSTVDNSTITNKGKNMIEDHCLDPMQAKAEVGVGY